MVKHLAMQSVIPTTSHCNLSESTPTFPILGTLGGAISIDTQWFKHEYEDFEKLWDEFMAGKHTTKALYYTYSK